MEMFGERNHPRSSHHNLYRPGRPTAESAYALPDGATFDSAFHVFAVDWQASSLNWYVDGRLVHRVTDEVPAVPMYPVVNLALRDALVTPESVPAQLVVDYVRIYT